MSDKPQSYWVWVDKDGKRLSEDNVGQNLNDEFHQLECVPASAYESLKRKMADLCLEWNTAIEKATKERDDALAMAQKRRDERNAWTKDSKRHYVQEGIFEIEGEHLKKQLAAAVKERDEARASLELTLRRWNEAMAKLTTERAKSAKLVGALKEIVDNLGCVPTCRSRADIADCMRGCEYNLIAEAAIAEYSSDTPVKSDSPAEQAMQQTCEVCGTKWTADEFLPCPTCSRQGPKDE